MFLLKLLHNFATKIRFYANFLPFFPSFFHFSFPLFHFLLLLSLIVCPSPPPSMLKGGTLAPVPPPLSCWPGMMREIYRISVYLSIRDGLTALHIACCKDEEGGCIEYLLGHKATPSITDLKESINQLIHLD